MAHFKGKQFMPYTKKAEKMEISLAFLYAENSSN